MFHKITYKHTIRIYHIVKMGYCINCKGVLYSCGYTHWVNFREEIARSSVAYLQNEYDVLLANGANDSYLENELSKLMEYLNIHHCGTIPDFMGLFSEMDMLNLFLYYGMGGVYALLNKSDDDGYYSVGNSVDIVDTFHRVEKYISDDDIRLSFPQIQKVFQTSIDTRHLVAIY